MDRSKYLERIGYSGTVAVDFQTLAAVLKKHISTVPFENTDIYYRLQFIQLNLPWLYNKLVLDSRGGYCYELNGLLAWLLCEIGFNVSLVSARVWRNDSYTPEYDHLALVVTMGGEDWLVDSGFGNFACTPIPIKNNVLHKDDTGQYSISRVSYDGRLYWQVSRMLQAKGEYIPEYLFTKAPQQLHDFAKRNFYHQTSPDSHFIRNFMCSRWAEAGRISIVNNFLIRNGENGRSATAITGLDDKQQLLEKWFQLKVDLPQRSALVAQGQ